MAYKRANFHLGMIRLVLGLCVGMLSLSLQAQQFTQRIYPGVAPGSEDWTQEEVVRTRPGGARVYANVRDPELTAYLPDAALANGAAIIILPGGALRFLGVGQETNDMIEFFNAKGIAVFYLKYRVLQEEPVVPGAERPQAIGPGNLPELVIRNGNANPLPNHEGLNRVLELAIDDAQEALKIVRSNAQQWNIDPARVGLFGTSAGGGVAFGTLIENKAGLAPNFVASLFGPSLMDVVLPDDIPPIFMATETGHGPVTSGLIALLEIWIEAGGSAELLVFDVPSLWNALWEERFLEWMEEQDLF